MTIEEVKALYGEHNSNIFAENYVRCTNCPLSEECSVLGGSGFEDCWEAIAKFMTDKEINAKPLDAVKHDGCKGCRFDSLEENEFPCYRCRGTCIPYSDEYKSRTDYYQPLVEVTDFVNSPPHYTQGGIECIEAMESAFGRYELATYCKIAAFKYIWRCKYKNGIEDVKKAVWYLNKYIDLMEKDE